MKKKSGEKKYVRLLCVTPPDEKQKAGLLAFLEGKYGACELDIVEEPSLGGGFRIEAGSDVYDWSIKGRVSHATISGSKRLRKSPSHLEMWGEEGPRPAPRPFSPKPSPGPP